MGFKGFKVAVSGGSKKNNAIINNSKVEGHTVAINMKENKVEDVIPNEEVSNANYFKNIYKMVKDGTMSIENAAHMITLELKRVYIEAIIDEHFGVEEIEYSDKLIFNSLEEIVYNIIEKAFTPNTEFQASVYKETIFTAISSSVKVLDYESSFDFTKMNWMVIRFVDDFNK